MRRRSTTSVPHPFVSAKAPGVIARRVWRMDDEGPEMCECGRPADVTGICERCKFLDDYRPKVFTHWKSGETIVRPPHSRQLEIVPWLRHHPDSTLREITDGVVSTPRATLRALRVLIESGRVRTWEDTVEFDRVFRHHTTHAPVTAPSSLPLLRYRLTSK